MSVVAKIKFLNYRQSITKALDAIAAETVLPPKGLIIIKPNLTNSSPPPVTTNVAAAEAVYNYCKVRTNAEVAVGEGCGQGQTADVFKALGYADMADRHGIRLIDFNTAETTLVKDDNALQLKSFHMPAMVPEAFVISLPVLKDHSFTTTTIAMKNMFGIAPAPFYAGSWNKSKLHSPSTHQSVVDICRYKKPDLCVVDASVALKGMHLAGTAVKLRLILAGTDPVAVDAVGSRLLGRNPARLKYLALSEGLHGSMNNIRVVQG